MWTIITHTRQPHTQQQMSHYMCVQQQHWCMIVLAHYMTSICIVHVWWHCITTQWCVCIAHTYQLITIHNTPCMVCTHHAFTQSSNVCCAHQMFIHTYMNCMSFTNIWPYIFTKKNKLTNSTGTQSQHCVICMMTVTWFTHTQHVIVDINAHTQWQPTIMIWCVSQLHMCIPLCGCHNNNIPYEQCVVSLMNTITVWYEICNITCITHSVVGSHNICKHIQKLVMTTSCM